MRTIEKVDGNVDTDGYFEKQVEKVWMLMNTYQVVSVIYQMKKMILSTVRTWVQQALPLTLQFLCRGRKRKWVGLHF